ncbi:MAG: hypothetical protein FGM20_12195 [Burkholderiaceae bacterium]|nr:hypothetical protein [Burkholderiaceae bacterium]
MNPSHTSIPSQPSDTYNPNLQSAPPSDTHEPQGKGSNRDTTPKLSSKADNTEDFWLQLEALHRMAQERKKIEEAANKTQPMSIESSDPSLHSHQHQVSNRRDQSSSSTENGYPQYDEKHNEQKGGVDPVFFEKLGKLNRKEISVIEINKPKPERTPGPGPRVNGEWTSLHLLALRDPNQIPELIASGASLDAVNKDGLTLLHIAFFRRDADTMRQLLAAGANPLIRHGIYGSPLAFALVTRKELAMTLAEAVPGNAKANVEEDGDTEVHMAVQLPEVLYVLLSKGMQDSANGRGVTALMMAAVDGQLQSVKYLLGQRPKNEKESDYLAYINSTDNVYGMTALGHACDEDHLEIVELLLKHGANLYHPSDQKSLLKVAADKGNIRLLNLLLENGAAEYEPDLTNQLFTFVKRGQSEVVQALGPYVTLNRQQQYKLLSHWANNPQPKLLAAISRLITATVPSVRSMIEGPGILTIPLAKKSPGLLAAVLEFFDRRDTFNYVLQRYISIFLDGQGEAADTAMGKVLLDFALSRFSILKGDRETVMRLLQLSEKLQDYRLATLIKDGHDSTSFFKSSAIPFNQKWISDPVMRDFLSDVPNNSSTSKGIWLGKKLVSSVVTARQAIDIDGANLSNELIFALKEKSIDTALDTIFKNYKLSGLVSQTLKYSLVGLITELYPDPATRSSAVCRLIIGYCFSTLSDNSKFTEHGATQIMKSDDHWKSVKRKVDAEVDEIEGVGSALIDSFAANLSSEKILPLVTKAIIDSLDNSITESELASQFQSTLGLLETPARRLAAACLNAGKRWQDRLPSSAQGSRHRLNFSALEVQFKEWIGQALRDLRRQAKLPDQLAAGLSAIESDLVPAFQQIVFFQLDLIEQAFGVFQPLPGDTLANFVSQITQNRLPEETSDEAISNDQSTESTGSAYLDSEESYRPQE